ncbi:MAG: hypothetical protein AAF518_18545 [Spirochaetota bacterium]
METFLIGAFLGLVGIALITIISLFFMNQGNKNVSIIKNGHHNQVSQSNGNNRSILDRSSHEKVTQEGKNHSTLIISLVIISIVLLIGMVISQSFFFEFSSQEPDVKVKVSAEKK